MTQMKILSNQRANIQIKNDKGIFNIMANLLEAYGKRLNLAEKLYSKAHNGERLSESKKILIAKCLENTQR